ncbi:hypothetical protein ACFFGT_04150 [Mucilaginibacter angelicae]|uniref:Uncharacterized protein n=1 Tax=Mucilaginibacter angelicae TaxID=869718 RepID=A0ABV6L0X2_9SPHI
MKKIFTLAAFALIFAAACNQVQVSGDLLGIELTNKENPNHTNKVKNISPPAEQITLNGLDLAEAGTRVSRFLQNKNSSDAVTNIWFSKAYIDSIHTLLKAEKLKKNVDGIRIYFAKNSDNRNSVVIVSTIEGDPNPAADSKHYHTDYFDHDSPFLHSNEAAVKEAYNNDTSTGALLYGPDPCAGHNCTVGIYNFIPCTLAYRYTKLFSKPLMDATSVWYGIKLLDHLVAELDSATKQGKVNVGIRLYFTKPNTHYGFIVVTTENIKGINRDYFDCYAPFTELEKEGVKGQFGKFIVFDKGEECPINCKGATWQ